jgi:hypothetical protein
VEILKNHKLILSKPSRKDETLYIKML